MTKIPGMYSKNYKNSRTTANLVNYTLGNLKMAPVRQQYTPNDEGISRLEIDVDIFKTSLSLFEVSNITKCDV